MPPTSQTEDVGATTVARTFFAGQYEEVLAQTIDSSRGGASSEDMAFTVGALAFVGRLTEAEVLADSMLRAGSARSIAASGFFLAVAHSRAGKVEDGRRALAEAERATRGRRDAWSRAFLWQAIACCHFFQSDFARAELATTHALRNAQVAQLAYGQLLANDMRGHLLLRRGRFLEGMRVLQRARQQAQQLDFVSNAHAIEISHEIARAALAPWKQSCEILEALLGQEHAQDTYSRRAILLELATRYAFLGDAARAWELTEECAQYCASDPRATAALYCARAHVTRASQGGAAAAEWTRRAVETLPPDIDAVREAEIAALQLQEARRIGDAHAATTARDRLERSYADGLYRAGAWLYALGETSAFEPAEGDLATPAMRAARLRPVAELVDTGLLGLLAENIGEPPGRRLHLLPDAMIIEDHGDLERLPGLSPRCRQVLEAIARGRGGREDLLDAVWGLRSYRAERHDAVIKTTVSRLRAALGCGGRWIVTESAGYGLVSGVELRRDGHAPMATEHSISPDAGTGNERQRKILEAILRAEVASLAPLARRLGIPKRTLTRELTALKTLGLVERHGKGPATRYRLAARVLEGMTHEDKQ